MAFAFGAPDPRKTNTGADRSSVHNYFGAIPVGLQSEVYNLAKLLLRDVAFMVPRYQRPYSWTEEHIGKLIQDLRRAWERHGAFYFIGHFVFVRTETTQLHIADGQQRLATLTMILAYVRERLGGRGDFYQALICKPDGAPRLRLRPADSDFFAQYVQQPGRFYDLAQVESAATDSQAAISMGAEVIANALADMTAADLENFAKFICRCALFDVIEADEPGGAAIVFTTVNDRGLDLSAADLMKSALLERAAMSEADKDQAALDWESLEDRLGRGAFGELLDLTPTIFGGELLAPGDLGAFVQTLYARQSVEVFLRDWLPRHGQALFEIRNECVGGPHAYEINRRIKCLKQLKDQTWLPVAVSFLANHGRDHDKTRLFFRGLDLIAFCVLLSAVRSEAREARWKRAILADGDPKKLFDEEHGCLTLRPAERAALVARLGQPFRRDKAKESEKRKLILIRINACLPGGDAVSRDADISVEHILPVKGGPDWNDKFTEKERDAYAHLIGNWTLVTADQNRRCGNKGFAHKRKIFFEEGAPMRAVTRTLERVQEWDADAIDARLDEFRIALFLDWGLRRD